MGRSKYSLEAKNAIMAAFVKATKKIISEQGVEAASIRRVSTAAGYSSATLYLYFTDMNELVTMSLISYLSDYAENVINSTPIAESAEDAYLRSWELFCMHAFANPTVYLRLFYGPQSDSIDAIAKKYYELFPKELKQARGAILEMLELGDLSKRNHVLLESFSDDLGLSDHDIDLANDLTIAYFHSFLDEAKKREENGEGCTDLVDRFLEGALFVLRR